MLNNDTIQYPLPGDLQSRVENAQNQVTTLEAEAHRLDKYVNGRKAEVMAIHNEYKDIEARIKSAKENLKTLSEDLNEKNEQFNRLSHAVSDRNHELEEATRQKVEIVQEIDRHTLELHKSKIAMDEAEKELVDRIKSHEQKETDHQKKVEKLLEALK